MSRPSFLDDMGQVLAALFGAAVSERGQASTQLRQRLLLLQQRLGLVSREEFDALHDLLKEARLAQTALEARLAQVERAAGKERVKEPLKKSAKKSNKSRRSA